MSLQIQQQYEEDSGEDEDEPLEIERPEDQAKLDAAMDEFLDDYEVLGGKLAPKIQADTPAGRLDAYRRGILGVSSEGDEAKREKERILQVADEIEAREEEDPLPEMFNDWLRPAGDKWDCETVLCESKARHVMVLVLMACLTATYSNLENHPKLLRVSQGLNKRRARIDVDPKTGFPVVAAEAAPVKAIDPPASDGRLLSYDLCCLSSCQV